MSGAAPSGWASSTLGEVLEVATGKLDANAAVERGVYPFFTCGKETLHIDSFAFDQEAVLLAGNGDFGVKHYIGKFNAYQRTYVLGPRGVDGKFLFHLICARIPQITENERGSTVRYIRRGDIEVVPIEVPPLMEQRRIVAKIDSLSEKSKRARDRLDHVPRLVEAFKRAILGAIFQPFEAKERLECLVDEERGIPYGIIQTGENQDAGVPTVRCGDIKRFQADVTSLKQVDPAIEREYARTRLRGGEVLIAVRGSVGETCVARSNMAGFNISREVAMIPVLPSMSPDFVMYYLASPTAQEFIRVNVKGVAQQGINLRDLRALPVPVGAHSHQVNVVGRIETAFAWIDRLAREAQSARKLIDRLDQAILSKAFRGELVPQDPNDEPASVLLERIRAERDNRKTLKTHRRRLA